MISEASRKGQGPGVGGGGTETNKQNKLTKKLAGAKALHFKNNTSLYEK